MLPEFQREFAQKIYSDKKHAELLAKADAIANTRVEWRISEMPVFLSHEFRKKIERYSVEIAEQCIRPPHSIKSALSLEPRYTARNEDAKPLFVIADFALIGSPEEGFDAKLVELQGFPSLFAYQFEFSRMLREHYELYGFDYALSGLTDSEYLGLFREAVLGQHSPDDVILTEYKPKTQKTRPDFLVTQRLTGARETDICSLVKRGAQLYYQLDGAPRHAKRIYNRAIVDELESERAELPFAWTDELDVEWAGHPNWYFKISKHSLPYLNHAAVPSARFLDELDVLPRDLENYVLKPLYSFAGKGVNVAPKESDVAAIAPAERNAWLLQEKIKYAEALYTPEGANKAEIRIMMIWPPDAPKPKPVISLARTGRGPMMGVRYNNAPWTGSNACFFG